MINCRHEILSFTAWTCGSTVQLLSGTLSGVSHNESIHNIIIMNSVRIISMTSQFIFHLIHNFIVNDGSKIIQQSTKKLYDMNNYSK